MLKLRATPWTFMKSRMLIQEGGDVHAQMRNIVNRGFTPKRIRAWEKRAIELSEAGLEGLRARGEFDLVPELAIPLPVTIIAEMLGVERERVQDFKSWSDEIIEGATGPEMATAGGGRALEAMAELRKYVRPLVEARRKDPRDDLISVLLTAELDRGDTALSDFEVFLFVLLLLIAGNETTTNLLGNTVNALLDNPSQVERVNADPSLVTNLVEEALRFDSPVQFVEREALEEVEIAGTRIPKQGHLVVLLGSANRDDRQFENPDTFDVERDARGHVALGFGEHFCLGAALARLEAKSALSALLPELPRLTRISTEQNFVDSYQIRGRRSLKLRYAS
jgi:cytochrome P450